MRKLLFIIAILLSQTIHAAEISIPRVYFPFAVDYLLPDMNREIDENIKWLEEKKNVYVILEGHCDEFGSKDFNMELGDRRARAIKAYMIEHGIPSERIIMVVSYGSSHPRSLGRRVEDMRENRRVEFVLR